MAKTKEQKKAILERLENAIKTSPSTVFVHFTRLPVSEETHMRSSLRAEGVSYFVARKTLMKRAFTSAGIEGEQPALEGEVAIAYSSPESLAKRDGSDDPTAPARSVYTFVKQFGGKLSIIGGVFEGRFMDAAEMNEVATIPPIDTLRGMFANVINSPIQGLVVALNAIAEKKEA